MLKRQYNTFDEAERDVVFITTTDSDHGQSSRPFYELKDIASYYGSTIVPTKSDSHMIFCLQLLSI